MDFEAILLELAPKVDAALGGFLDFVAQARGFLGLTAFWGAILEFFGNLFAGWGISIV